jgi:hypothetical protein
MITMSEEGEDILGPDDVAADGGDANVVKKKGERP